MAVFKQKTNLPQATQDEIDRIEAIDSGKRTTAEANFLTSLEPYRTNKVLRYRTSGKTTPDTSIGADTDLILEADSVADGEADIDAEGDAEGVAEIEAETSP